MRFQFPLQIWEIRLEETGYVRRGFELRLEESLVEAKTASGSV